MTIQNALDNSIYWKDRMDGTYIFRTIPQKKGAVNPYKQKTFSITECSICGESYFKCIYQLKAIRSTNWCSPKCRREATRGENNPKYKKYKVSKDGYEYINYWEDGKRKHMDMQRVVMQKHLGRKLCPKTEKVHHIDMDKLNNNIDNLWICNNSKHMIAHHSMNELVATLIKLGIVKFDKEKGVYKLINQ